MTKQLKKGIPYAAPFRVKHYHSFFWVEDSEGRQAQYEGEGSLWFLQLERAEEVCAELNAGGEEQ